MNRKEALWALQLLDVCIDDAGHPAVILALDTLRRNLLRSWQQGLCRSTDAEPLIAELSALPALSRDGLHPGLPMKLCQAMFSLHAPAVEPEQELLVQSREQAERIRCLRRWKGTLADLLTNYDEETLGDAGRMMEMQLTMMAEVFSQLLALDRGRMAQRAAQHRTKRFEEIAGIRDGLCLKDVYDSQTDALTASAMTKEKFTEFAADIASPEVLLKVTEPEPAAAVRQHEEPEEEMEE